MKILFFFISINLAVCFPCAQFNVSETKGPEISFKEKKMDFGTVRKRKEPLVSVRFEFENTGDSPLVVIKADVSCDCL